MTADHTRYPSLDVFLFGEPDNFFEYFDEIHNADSFGVLLAPTVLSFKQNLRSAIQVGEIPYQLVHTSTLHRRYFSILSSERIRQLANVPSGAKLGVEHEVEAKRIARTRMSEEMSDEKIVQRHAADALDQLDAQLDDVDFRSSSEELLRQILVMIWGALETFINDILRATLNSKPSLVLGLLKHPQIRNSFISRDALLDALVARDFNASDSMGDIVLNHIRLDNIDKMRDFIGALIENRDFNSKFADESLWLLAQRRHLIVHRRGIIDKKYLESTSDDFDIGCRLSVSPKYIEDSLILVRDIGISFYQIILSELQKVPKDR